MNHLQRELLVNRLAGYLERGARIAEDPERATLADYAAHAEEGRKLVDFARAQGLTAEGDTFPEQVGSLIAELVRLVQRDTREDDAQPG